LLSAAQQEISVPLNYQKVRFK
jgi:hypothetical protein